MIFSLNTKEWDINKRRRIMFEKESKEYLIKDGTKAEQIFNMLNEISPLKITSKQVPFILAMIQQTFQDGAEFGYNKANEWHYPSKGEYPKDEKEYLVIYESDHTKYIGIESYYLDTKEWSTICKIVAWKEIVLPELKENE